MARVRVTVLALSTCCSALACADLFSGIEAVDGLWVFSTTNVRGDRAVCEDNIPNEFFQPELVLNELVARPEGADPNEIDGTIDGSFDCTGADAFTGYAFSDVRAEVRGDNVTIISRPSNPGLLIEARLNDAQDIMTGTIELTDEHLFLESERDTRAHRVTGQFLACKSELGVIAC